MNIKDKSLLTYRTRTHRDVEDWRKDTSPERQGPWAVHCLEHRQRRLFTNYLKAKSAASLAWPCPVCDAFDQRCGHCPSDHATWEKNSAMGFTASAGHITGKPVCLHHQYGSIPQGVDYHESLDASPQKPLIDIFLGDLAEGVRVLSVRFNVDNQSFWLISYDASDYLSVDRAERFLVAFGFAVQVAVCLNERLKPTTDDRPYGFETWEACEARHSKR